MRKIYKIFVTLVVLLSMAMSVQALEYKAIERHNGAHAEASWTETQGDMTTSTYLYVDKADDDTYVYLETYTSGPDIWSGKSGSTYTTDNVFKIDKKLNSASLSEIQIDVYDWYTGETETVTVKADWTGKGEISQGSYKSSSRNGDYTFRSSESSSSREASVTGSMNNYDLGINSYGMISQYKNAFITMEK